MRRAASVVLGGVVSGLVLVPRPAGAQGNPLGPEFRVNTYTTGDQRSGAAAMDASGNFVVVWSSDQDGSMTGVFGQRYASSGVALGQEFRVNTYTTSFQGGAVVTSDSVGNFVVIWHSVLQDGSNIGIFGQRFASSGAPLGTEFRVNTFTPFSQFLPAVGSDSSGNFVVVWMSGNNQDGDLDGVFGQRYSSSGAPLGAEFRVNTYTTHHQNYPSVAVGSSGNFVVVWHGELQEGSGYGVFGQRYANSGAPLGPEFRVNTYTSGFQRLPSAAMDSSGSFVVVWQDEIQDGLGYGIFGQRYASSGAPLGPEFRVNTYTTEFQAYPRVAVDTAGNFIVTWAAYPQDGSQSGIFGQRYGSSGAPLGTEFRVNSYTTANQLFPSVASDPAGRFVIVWNSFGQDGSFYGTFGQRYAPIVPVELMHFRVE